MRHFDLANELYRENRFADALVEYDAAYERSKNWKILYNRGQCLVLLRREPEAIASFEQYLAEGGAAVDAIEAGRRDKILKDIQRLRGRLGTLRIEGIPDGFDVQLDGRPAGRTPIPPIVTSSGPHELTIRGPTGAPTSVTVKVVSGSETLQRFEVSAAPTAPAAPEPPREPVLPPLPAGGLPTKAFYLSAATGLEFGIGRLASREPTHVTPTFELSAGYRFSRLFELGIFGRYGTSSEETTSTTSQVATTMTGFRTRLHLLRSKTFDGFLGVDLGVRTENWSVRETGTDFAGSPSVLFGLSAGADMLLSPSFAIGLAGRYTVADSGLPNCSAANTDPCGSRRGFDLSARIVWSINAEPAITTPVPSPARTSASRLATGSPTPLARFP